MLLQTNSYIVPKDKRSEHSRLIRRFRQTLLRLGCDHFEVYEQVGANWSNSESNGRYVQILRFLDRKHQLAVQAAERVDPTAQAVIADFCDLINFPYQQQQGLFAVGFYTSVLPIAPKRGARGELVSTVEHEVINDPEAEQPYDEVADEPVAEEVAGKDLGEESTSAVDAVTANQSSSAPETSAAENPMSENGHVGEHSAASGESTHQDQSATGDDFMNMVSDEIHGVNPAPGADDEANGFIDAEVVDEQTAPAHPAKDHPPGW
jgi:hypothetical protein